MRKIQGIAFYRKIARIFLSGIKIREVKEDDLGKLRLWLSLYNMKISDSYDPSVTNFTANRHGKIIGYVQLVRIPEEKYFKYGLFSLTVKGVYRGTGTGEKLCKAVIEKAKAEGANELFLNVYEDNYRAINLYSKLGFKEAPEKPESERTQSVYGRRNLSMIKTF